MLSSQKASAPANAPASTDTQVRSFCCSSVAALLQLAEGVGAGQCSRIYGYTGAQFTCFTSTKVQILTQKTLLAGRQRSHPLLLYYK